MSQNNNPLSQYFRQFRKFIKLPSSSGDYLDKSVIEYDNDKKEVGVRPMTAADEMLFKNPDALLNGEAITKVITSCVPAIKNPKKLLTNDVDLLLVAIYAVSQGKDYDIEVKCENEKCRETNKFTLDLDNVISDTDFLDDAYPVHLQSGLTAFVSPYTYEMALKAISLQFEEGKFLETIEESDITDTAKMQRISETINKVSKLNFDLISDSVMRIIKEEDDPEIENLDVTDREHIRGFIENIELSEAKAIEKEIRKANEVGLPDKYPAKCTHCEHEWEAEISFNPTDFFINT